MDGLRSSPRLALYSRARCIFCLRVTHAAGQLGVELELRDVADPWHERELVAATGRKTVPALRIEHLDSSVEWLPESREIVRYLRRHAGE